MLADNPAFLSRKIWHKLQYICNKMKVFITITVCIVFVPTILYVVSSRLLINTSKRCVEYRVPNSRWNDTVLRVILSVGYSECLMQCTRHQNCSAINFRSGTGTCELLPGIGDCTETRAEERSTFVHFGYCSGRVPWVAERRNWSSGNTCLTWEPHDATRSTRCPGDVLRGPDPQYCAALAPHKGLYLPGWYQSRGGFRMVTELGAPNTCLGARAGYLLRVATECPTDWQDYLVTDPVPLQAVQVSSWKDGTAIYFVSAPFMKREYLGYYIPSVQRSFIMSNRAQNPISVRILVYV